MANITHRGNPVHTSGELPAVGSKAPDFRLTDANPQVASRLARCFDRDVLAARAQRDIWRYRELLPVEEPAHWTPLRVGGTPMQ